MIVTKHLFSLLLLIGLVITGCGGAPEEIIPTEVNLPTAEPTLAPTQTAEPTNTPAPIPTEFIIPKTVADNPDEQAYMRIINAAPELDVVDVYVEALALATNLSYGVLNEREEIASGRYTVRILPSGSFVTDEPLYEETLNIFGGESLIFVITGTPENVTFTRLNESNEPLPNDTSRLMMVNALTGGDDLVMLLNDVPQTAITPYLQISEVTTSQSRRVTLTFRNAGAIVAEQLLDLRERENYTIAVVGDVTQPEDIRLLILQSSAPGITSISLVNAAPSIGLVDIYFGDELIVNGASYGENSVPQQILSGIYDVSVYAEGANPDDVTPITGTQFIANPDELIALVLIGEPNALRFATYRSNPQPTYDNQTRIAFLNSLQSIPNILLQSNNEQLDQRLSYGRVTNSVELLTGDALSFTWIQQLPDSQDIALETLTDFSLEAGLNYLYIFAGRGFDEPILLSYEVGTLGFETVIVEEEEELEPVIISQPTEVRLLNIWEGRQVNVRVDGTVVAEGLDYGNVTNPLVIEAGERNILFSDIDGDFELVEITETFEEGNDYFVVIFNNLFDDELEGDILLIDETNANLTTVSSAIRLIVLEAALDSRYGLGYSLPSDQLTQPNAEEDFRRSIPVGIEQIVRDVPEFNASTIQRLPTGPHNIRIIDNREAKLSFTHTEVVLEPAILYNVFLWENPRTRQTTTIIVPHSSQ